MKEMAVTSKMVLQIRFNIPSRHQAPLTMEVFVLCSALSSDSKNVHYNTFVIKYKATSDKESDHADIYVI